MAAKRVAFVLGFFLIATAVEGFGPNFGLFPGFSPEGFVAQHVPLPWNNFPINPVRFPKIPNQEDIIAAKPLPGQEYQAIFVSSSSGKEPEIVVNHNGQVYKQKIPKTKSSSESPKILKSEYVRPTFAFPSFDFKFPDPETIKHRVPSSPNEQFVSYSESSQTSFVNNNGVKKAKGQIHSIINNNGKVEERVIQVDD